MTETQGQRFRRIAAVGTASGVVGWALENVWSKINGEGWRFSAAFGGAPVPFLPVYAVGGATIAAVGPALKEAGLPWPLRGASYALTLGILEFAACKLDRKLLASQPELDRDNSWHYGEGEESIDGGGCVDESHVLAWGVLGLLAERFALPR